MLKLAFVALGLLMYRSVNGAPNLSSECSQCVQLLESDILSAQVFNFASDLCDQLSDGNHHLCRDSLTDIWAKSPRDICQMLGVCPLDGKSDALTFMQAMAALNRKDLQDTGLESSCVCHLCKVYTTFIQNYLPGHKHQIISTARSLCGLFPSIESTCVSLVDTYGLFVLHLAEHFISPQLCVTYLGC